MNNCVSITNYAINHIQFYGTLYSPHTEIDSEIFKYLPTLTKTDVREAGDRMLNNITKNKHIQIFRTSGTTGIPLNIYWNRNEYIKSNFYSWHLRKKWYGIMPSDSFCTFHSSVESDSHIQMESIISLHNGRVISLGRYLYNDDIMQQYVDALNDFKPVWILGYSSCIYRIGCFLERTGQKIPSLRYIELNGEYTDDNLREDIKNKFGISVGELYGSVEFNGIAMRCPEGNMHVLNNNVYIEMDNSDELLITGLVNTYMPLIRYRIGDCGSFDSHKCSCGNESPIIHLTRGRNNKIINLKNGDALDVAFFNSLIDEIQIHDSSILQFFIEIHDNKIVLVVLVKKEREKQLHMKKRYLLSKFKYLNCSTIDVDLRIESDARQFYNGDSSKFQFIQYK